MANYNFVHLPKLAASFNFYAKRCVNKVPSINWESVAGSVIQATVTVEIEDGWRTGALPKGASTLVMTASIPGSNPNPPQGVWADLSMI